MWILRPSRRRLTVDVWDITSSPFSAAWSRDRSGACQAVIVDQLSPARKAKRGDRTTSILDTCPLCGSSLEHKHLGSRPSQNCWRDGSTEVSMFEEGSSTVG